MSAGDGGAAGDGEVRSGARTLSEHEASVADGMLPSREWREALPRHRTKVHTQTDSRGLLPSVHGPWRDDDPREVARRAELKRARRDEMRRAKEEAARRQEAKRAQREAVAAAAEKAHEHREHAEATRQHARSTGVPEPRRHRKARPPPQSAEEVAATAATDAQQARAALVRAQEEITLLNFRKVSKEVASDLEAAKREIASLKAKVASLEAKVSHDE